ncbi:MAG: GNAT family N-acetyltransferase [Thermodesulfobacteriota bacterium]
MDIKLRVEYLADHPEVIPILKEWFETEWASYYGPAGPGDAYSDLLAYANRDELPVGVVAFFENEVCGVAALKSESITTHSHLGPWAAAGLVSPLYQRREIGTELVRAIEQIAKNLGYAHPQPTAYSSAGVGNLWRVSNTMVSMCPSTKRRSNKALRRTI